MNRSEIANKALFISIVILLQVAYSCGKEDLRPRDLTIIEPSEYSLESSSVVVKISNFRKYMDLRYTTNTSFQGSAVFGNYLFQSHHSNDVIDVYDLNKKELVFTIRSEANTLIHNNNVCFGALKYEESDEFPLLYLEGRGYTHHTYLYRIVKEADNYVGKQVQSINFSSESWSTTTNNLKDSTLCVYHGYNKKDMYSIIKTPGIYESNIELEINDTSRLDSMSVNIHDVGQDATIHNGIIYHLGGYSGDGYLHMTNLYTHKHYPDVKLSNLGFTAEPEGICFWNNTLLITSRVGTVYSAKITIEEFNRDGDKED